ncbi:MAG: hypothetical protein HDR11_17480 [Lachnospiraceae bacterium]|nr:hypothetical protein [Lachnospiraceae bacterium]MBD5511814.1 hypothetical protein [Lachnospiraceae bacterium]
MKATDVYLKTMKFVWLKLALGGVIFLISAITMFLFLWIGSLSGSGGGVAIALCLWAILIGGVFTFAERYIGYMLKAGHVAMVTTAVTTGTLPENQLEAAKSMVKERFATANVYFVVDRLVSGAVSQLQRGLQKVEDLLGKIPGVSVIVSFAQLFVHIALNYIDECCLGYTFLHREQSAFKSAADGVVIYFQNWKALLKNAAVTTLIVMGISLVAWLLPFLIFVGLFSLLHIHWIFAFILALIIAAIIKSSFVDSYMMVKMMVSYMQVAPSTEITFDLYDKLCKLSAKFRNLFNKGQQEQQQYGNAQM